MFEHPIKMQTHPDEIQSQATFNGNHTTMRRFETDEHLDGH